MRNSKLNLKNSSSLKPVGISYSFGSYHIKSIIGEETKEKKTCVNIISSTANIVFRASVDEIDFYSS